MNQFLFPNKPIRTYSPKEWLKSIKSNDWLVQPKLDGKRALVSLGQDNKLIVYNRYGQPCQENRKFQFLKSLNLPKPFLLDGELLRNNKIVIWDYAILNGKSEYNLPYLERFNKLQSLFLKNKISEIEIIASLDSIDYLKILAKTSSFLEGVVFKMKQATNLWGLYSTSEVGSQIKYRLK